MTNFSETLDALACITSEIIWLITLHFVTEDVLFMTEALPG